MRKLKPIFLFIALLIGTVSAQAETLIDTATKHPVKSIFVNAGLQYISNLTYAGRRDLSSVPVVLPTLTLISGKGLFLNAIGYFDLNGHSSQTEGLSITPGYVFSFDKKKEAGGAISATKYFITDKSPIILSSFNATIDGQLHYDPAGVVKMTVAGSYRIGKNNQNDVITNAGLSKEIVISKSGSNNKDRLKFTPDITLYSGTQSFYQTYYTSSEVQRAVDEPASQTSPINLLFPNQPKQTIVTQTVTEQKQRQVKQFGLLALSGSTQLTYTLKTWQLNFTPYLIKPYNQVNYVSNTSQNGLYFLFTTGVSVTF